MGVVMSESDNAVEDAGAPTSAPEIATGDVKKMVEQALALRDMVAAIRAEADERCKPLNEALGRLRASLLIYMNQHNIQSVKTAAGTAYVSARRRAVLRDMDAFLAWVRRTGASEVIDISVNAAAAWEYAEENRSVPDGVALSSSLAVNFRSS